MAREGDEEAHLKEREKEKSEMHHKVCQAHEWGEDLHQKAPKALQLAKEANHKVQEALYWGRRGPRKVAVRLSVGAGDLPAAPERRHQIGNMPNIPANKK